MAETFKMTPEESDFQEGEVQPGGYYEPKGLSVKKGENIAEVFKDNPNPEMLRYSKALLKDMIEDYKLMGKQIAQHFSDRIDKVKMHLEELEKIDSNENQE